MFKNLRSPLQASSLAEKQIGFGPPSSASGLAEGTTRLYATDSCELELATRVTLEELAVAVLLVHARQLGSNALALSLTQNRLLTVRFEDGCTFRSAFATAVVSDSADSAFTRIHDIRLVLAEEVTMPEPGWLILDQRSDHSRLRLVTRPAEADLIAHRDFIEKIARVLTQARLEPDAPLAELSLITDSARTVLADPSQPLPAQVWPWTHQVFFEVADQHPDAAAIQAGDRRFTYGELSRVARHLAHQLLEAGLAPGDVVAIRGSRSFGTIASMLAILAAGGVLVTVDTTLPAERQTLIQSISKPRWTIDVVSSGHACAGDGSAPTLQTPAWPDAHHLAQTPVRERPALQPRPDSSAYIFFTSGSTGVPKGVLGTQLGLAHFLAWQRRSFPIGVGDRTAHLTALSFDVVLRDIFFPLTSGACLHIPDPELMRDARRVLRWMKASRITAMHCVPSLMKAWLQAPTDDRPFRALRIIFFAGEPLMDGLLHRFRSAASPHTTIVNLYGPTETTLAKLSHRVKHVRPGIQSVGRPQPGVDVVILDAQQRQLGLGEIGEIAIRTPYRSQGYLGREDLTRQAFLPNPWRNDPNDQIYLTGDLGRCLPDGSFEILGRRDAQIKINGVRIEPNEIESQMLRVPGVKDAAVTVRQSASDDKQLFGLVVPDPSLDASRRAALNTEVREGLRAHLQEAMIPRQVWVMDSLPYLPNGKLDRKSLTSLDLASLAPAPVATPDSPARQALSPERRQLLEGLEQLLGRPLDRLDRSFIDYGGDSLSFIKATLLIEKAFGDAPAGWERQPIERLLNQQAQAESVPSSRWARIEVPVALRALAILLVVLSHTPTMAKLWELAPIATDQWLLTTTTLFVVAGMSFGRFLRPPLDSAGDAKPVLRMILAFGVPAGLWQALRAISAKSVWFPDFVLMGTFFQDPAQPKFTLWFLDVLAANLMIMAVILAAAFRWQMARGGRSADDPGTRFSTDLALVLGGLGVAFLQVKTGLGDGQLGQSGVAPFKWFWMLALGMTIQRASQTSEKRVLTALLAAMAVLVYSGPPWVRETLYQTNAFFFLAVLMCIWISRIPIPQSLYRPLMAVAAASLFIYIVNFAVIQQVLPALRIPSILPLEVVSAVLTGVAAKFLWDRSGGRWIR